MRRRYMSARALALALLLLAARTAAQDLAEFEKKVTEHTLRNGLKLILIERHDAPVLAFHNYVKVGSVNEHVGVTGVAHLFEHFAFKGTKTIGTTSYAAEKKALERLDNVYNELLDERARGDKADKQRLEQLEREFERAQEEAARYVKSNEFSELLEREGAVGLNAGTGYDSTEYTVSLPSNRIELWFSLESDRFLNPVIREFYKERDVVIEERRMRVDNNPLGKLFEEFLSVAYKAHPYGQPLIGHMSDLRNLTRAEAESFFRKHYVPQNMIVAIAGDVDPKQAIALAETYFGRLPSGAEPGPVRTVEPEQQGERRLEVEVEAQPILIIGYHRPDVNHPDDIVFDGLADILSGGRSSRLYKKLVKEKQIAVAVQAAAAFPANRYPSLFVAFAIPAAGRSVEELEKAIYEELERLQNEPVAPEELEAFKTRSRASLLRSLNSNEGLANLLASFEAMTGDWRNLFRQLDRIDKLTGEDLMRVARQYFVKRNRTVGYLTRPSAAPQKEEKTANPKP